MFEGSNDQADLMHIMSAAYVLRLLLVYYNVYSIGLSSTPIPFFVIAHHSLRRS